MKQSTGKSFIATYERAGLLPAGSHLVRGGGGQTPRRFTIWVTRQGPTGWITGGPV